MIQWHPIFAQLLRPAVEAYYEMETTFPVGDAPREADFVLLRRITASLPPFRGLWRNLTPWNVMEFKGPTVSPRRGHLESSIELGLGIELMGLGYVIEQVGAKRVIEEIGSKRFLEEIGSKRVLEEIGSKRFLEEIGSKRILEEVGLENFLANLSPAERRELKRRLQ